MQLDLPTYLKIWRHMWMLPNAIWYSFQDGVVETILVEKDDTVKLDNIEKVYDTYPPPDKNFKYEDPYVTDEEMRQLALERVIRMRVAT